MKRKSRLCAGCKHFEFNGDATTWAMECTHLQKNEFVPWRMAGYTVNTEAFRNQLKVAEECKHYRREGAPVKAVAPVVEEVEEIVQASVVEEVVEQATV